MALAKPIGFSDLLTVLENETPERIQNATKLPLHQALGRVLAEDIYATADAPVYTNSAMDGYAWRSSDFRDIDGATPVRLPVAATITAGHPWQESLPDRVAVRIMTGAVLPPGFDTVLPIEQTQVEDDCLILEPLRYHRGQNVRFAGEIYAQGDILLKASTVLGADQLGLIAANGLGVVSCRELRVGVFASGDELAEPVTEGKPQPNVVYNANGTAVTLFVQTLGASATYVGILPDDPHAIKAALEQAMETFDVVVCSGGVGPGDHDFTAQVLNTYAPVHHFHVAMKPGKPFSYAKINAPHPVFFVGLPGNPVATATAAQVFLRTIVCRLLGTPCRLPLQTGLFAGATLKSKFGRTDFIRAQLHLGSQGERLLTPLDSQSSASLYGAAHSNAILYVPDNITHLTQGDIVQYLQVGELT